jgi:hypothetical protein
VTLRSRATGIDDFAGKLAQSAFGRTPVCMSVFALLGTEVESTVKIEEIVVAAPRLAYIAT